MISPTALVTLIEAAGLAVSDLAAAESGSELNHVFHVTGAKAAAVPDATLFQVVDEYGDAIRIEFRTDGLVELPVAPGLTAAGIATFRANVAASPELEMAIRVNKPAMLQSLLDEPSPHAILFLFGAALDAILRSGLRRVDSELWTGRDGQLIILVLDTDIELRGPCLTVLGGAHLPAVVSVNQLPSLAPAALRRVAALRDRLVGWDEPFATNLTPWHFTATGAASTQLRELLDARLVDMTLLFICDRARRLQPPESGPIRVEFRGRDHVAFVPFDERLPLTGVTTDRREAMLRAVDWTFQLDAIVEQRPDWSADRLPFLQTRVAQVLEGRPEGERLQGFTTALPSVIEGVEWNWKAFVEDKVSGYLDQVKELEEIVTDTTDKVSGVMGDLIKALSDTMLAAVGVLIGTFIAAAFDTPFNDTVFRIGVLTYAAYVALFPGATGLFSASRQLTRAEGSFNYRRRSFSTALGEERVEQIVGDRLTKVKSSFSKTLAFAAAVYLAVTIGAVVAAIVVPDFIVDMPTAEG